MSYDFTFETQGINTYMVYQIKQQDKLDTLSLGMLTNNKIPGIAPVLFTQLDDKKYIKYNISSKVTVEQFFIGSISKKRLLGVFSSITSALLEADEYMIDMSEFLLDLNYMFVDVTSCEAVLVCLPVEQEEKQIDLGSFFKNVMFGIQFEQKENCDYVAKIINYLNSTPVFSLMEFKKILDGIRAESKVMTSAPVALTQGLKGMTPPNAPQPAVVQPSNVNIQKSLSGSIQGAQPQEKAKSSEVEQEGLIVKEKKSWFSFGFKNKKEKDNIKPVKEKKQKPDKKEKKNKSKKLPESVVQPEFAVPGAAVSPTVNVPAGTDASSAASIPAVLEQQKVEKTSIPTVNHQPVPVPLQNLNFGETTVLNSQVGETTVLSAGTSMEKTISPHLVRMRTQEKIIINKEIFRIGKEKSFVDYCISDNMAISRSHAHLVNRNEEFYIVDTNSTNHTFVNGEMIPSNQEVLLSDGVTVTLGNEVFKFKLY